MKKPLILNRILSFLLVLSVFPLSEVFQGDALEGNEPGNTQVAGGKLQQGAGGDPIKVTNPC